MILTKIEKAKNGGEGGSDGQVLRIIARRLSAWKLEIGRVRDRRICGWYGIGTDGLGVKLTVANILKDKYKATFDSYDGDAVDEDSEVRKYQLNTITVICDKSDIPKAFKDINDAIYRTDLQPIPEFVEFKDNIDEILNQYNEDPENEDLFRFGYAGDLMIKYVDGTLTVKYSSNVY